MRSSATIDAVLRLNLSLGQTSGFFFLQNFYFLYESVLKIQVQIKFTIFSFFFIVQKIKYFVFYSM